MQTADVICECPVGMISVRIFASEKMMDAGYEWLHEARKRPQHWQPPPDVDDFTLVMGYQAQIMLTTRVAGCA